MHMGTPHMHIDAPVCISTHLYASRAQRPRQCHLTPARPTSARWVDMKDHVNPSPPQSTSLFLSITNVIRDSQPPPTSLLKNGFCFSDIR